MSHVFVVFSWFVFLFCLLSFVFSLAISIIIKIKNKKIIDLYHNYNAYPRGMAAKESSLLEALRGGSELTDSVIIQGE